MCRLEEEEIMAPEVCIGCEDWNGGDGTKNCLKCKKIETLLPGMHSGEIRGTFVTTEEAESKLELVEEDPLLNEILNSTELLSLVEDLPETRGKTILKMRMENLSFREISKKLGISHGAVTHYYKNAVRRLRKARN
jgi:DNA-directed RNA polymerase specialized sigma subunit